MVANIITIMIQFWETQPTHREYNKVKIKRSSQDPGYMYM